MSAEEQAKVVYAVTGRGTTFGIDAISANSFAANLISHKSLLMTPRMTSMSPAEAGSLANRVAAVWQNDHSVMDKFAHQLDGNPAVRSRFQALSPQTAIGLFEKYKGHEQGLGPAVDAAYHREHPAAPAAPAAAAPKQVSEQHRTAQPHERSVAPADRTSPMDAAASRAADIAAPAAVVAGGAAALAAAPAAAGALSPDAAVTAFGKMIDKADAIFGAEFKPQEDALFKKLKGSDPSYREKLATAMNNDPDLLAQINSADGQSGLDGMVDKYKQQTPDVQVAVKNALHNPYKNLLEDPTLIAQKKFRDDLSTTATEAGTHQALGGMLSGIGDFFKDAMNGQGALGGLFSWLKDSFKDLWHGIQGLFNSNTMSMGNGNDMLSGIKNFFSEMTGQQFAGSDSAIHPQTGQPVPQPDPSLASSMPKVTPPAKLPGLDNNALGAGMAAPTSIG